MREIIVVFSYRLLMEGCILLLFSILITKKNIDLNYNMSH